MMWFKVHTEPKLPCGTRHEKQEAISVFFDKLKRRYGENWEDHISKFTPYIMESTTRKSVMYSHSWLTGASTITMIEPPIAKREKLTLQYRQSPFGPEEFGTYRYITVRCTPELVSWAMDYIDFSIADNPHYNGLVDCLDLNLRDNGWIDIVEYVRDNGKMITEYTAKRKRDRKGKYWLIGRYRFYAHTPDQEKVWGWGVKPAMR